MSFQISHLTIGSDAPRPVYVAEIGINHNGVLSTAIDLARAAIAAGADIVKTQVHLPDQEMLPHHPLYDLMRRCYLSLESLEILQQDVIDRGAVFMATPFCLESVDWLEKLGVPAYKIGSGECTHTPLLKRVADTGKPMIVSTGMTPLQDALTAVRGSGGQQVALMNCTSIYPALPAQAKLGRITRMRVLQQWPVGQSDHTPTISTALGAIAQGACIIEKHFTLDRAWPGPDQAGSVLPEEFAQLVQMGNEIWEATHAGWETMADVLDGEEPVQRWARHYVATTQPIEAGAIITRENTTVLRTAPEDVTLEIPAKDWESLLGQAVCNALPAGVALLRSDVGDYVPEVSGRLPTEAA